VSPISGNFPEADPQVVTGSTWIVKLVATQVLVDLVNLPSRDLEDTITPVKFAVDLSTLFSSLTLHAVML